MIGFLRGTILGTNNNSLLLDVAGVGYKVLVPMSLSTSLTEGEVTSLFIHTHVREDQISLFGFMLETELFLFEKLISISGIGPKGALAMLSVHTTASLADAIERGDAETLARTPGVGKKTAEKIIIELKGKLSHLTEGETDDAMLEVRLALETLGYSSKEIHNAIKNLSSDLPENKGKKSSSILIKEALQQLQ